MAVNLNLRQITCSTVNLWDMARNGPAQTAEPELLDLPGHELATLADCFRDLRLINRYFGGVGPVWKALKPFLPPLAEQPEIKLLDIACGAADVPLALTKKLTHLGYKVDLTVVDLNPLHIELAGQEARQQLEHGDGPENFAALVLDMQSQEMEQLGTFDFVTCSLAFHHFDPVLRLQTLKIMQRHSRRALVVNDLERSWFGYLGAHFLGLTITRNHLVRHDAPLSVRRSFKKREFEEMARQADLPEAKVKKALFSRLLLVYPETEVKDAQG